MKGFVEEIGKRFEFHRNAFVPEHVDAASNALDRLYDIFDTNPRPRRTLHDGKSPIVVEAGPRYQQHKELWDLLVPSKGAATTVQGEVIRISGQIIDELDRNGGGNWDAEYRKLANAFLGYLGTGNPLSPSDLGEAADLVARGRRK
jgi:hypothetical protein